MKIRQIIFAVILMFLVGTMGIILVKSTDSWVIAQAQAPTEKPKSEKVLEIAVEQNINGEVTSGLVQVRYEDPDTLPDESESAVGVFLGQKGNTITLGTGNIEVEMLEEIVNNEKPVQTVNTNHSGEPVEIRLTPDTVIYADVTPRPEIREADLEKGSMLVMRTIVHGSFEAIGEGMILRVWGPIEDGVVTAEVLAYESIE